MDSEEPLSNASTGRTATSALGSVLGSILGALVGFVLVASWGYSATPEPEDFPITVKLDYLEQHIGEYDALIIGKSHVFRSFVPEAIDDELSGLGIELRTFNMGGPGLPDVEIDHYLRRVLDLEGQSLSYVFIEAPDWVTATDENAFTNRSLAWHTPRQTWTMLRTLLLQDTPWNERVLEAWGHLRMLGQRYTAFGQGRRILRSMQGFVEAQPLTLAAVARDGGYEPMDDLTDPKYLRRRKAFLKHRDTYRERLEEISVGNVDGYDLERFNRAALESQLAAVRAAGARPIYIVPPGMDATPSAYVLAEAGLIPELLAFNDPLEYASIYRLARRYDGHLNNAGAEEFSRLFARTFARIR